MSKKKIAVLFGGQSSEHVVSCVSAANVIDQINKEKYDPVSYTHLDVYKRQPIC